jgi:hypothetical protein
MKTWAKVRRYQTFHQGFGLSRAREIVKDSWYDIKETLFRVTEVNATDWP